MIIGGEETAEDLRRRSNREWMARDRENNPDKYIRRSHANYLKNKKEINAKRKAWADANPERTLLLTAKNRAKRKDIPFEITLEDIVIPIVCPITLAPLKKGEGKVSPTSPTLDRIDNSRGYIPGNVAVISNRANSNKGDLTLEEIERLYLYSKGIIYNH